VRGIEKIPVIGLAKEFEEIYLPDKSEPLRPGLNHPAVKLLQCVRDECHRVANSYIAQLRLKKISESVLDEFPGIGDRRKSALLKKFGSVRRLQLATLEQIAAVPGFGGKAAAELKKVSGSAVNFGRPINQSLQLFSIQLFPARDRCRQEWPSPSILIPKET